MRKLLINLFLLCTGKDGIAMMAMLWAQEIMNQETVEDAKKMYERVPRLLKTKVKDILVRSRNGRDHRGMMTKLRIISRLWSHITDLRLYIRGQSSKTLEQIEDELDITEYYCRPYADVDDVDDV